jgi:hypothetical protein
MAGVILRMLDYGVIMTESRVNLGLNLLSLSLFGGTWEFEFRHKSYAVFLLVI